MREAYGARELSLGSLKVERALPVRERRLVGAWCFLDRFGPLTFGEGRAMDVAPHPHIGLQTVTWLLDGEVAHGDSLGCEEVARPGTVNVMTAGDGIAHAEWTPAANSGRLCGVQLWIALPEASRRGKPGFQHVAEVPVAELSGGTAHVFSGSLAGVASAARHFTEVVGAELRVEPGADLVVPLTIAHEHGVVRLDGSATLDGEAVPERGLLYLGAARASIEVRAGAEGARLLLIGGAPLGEPVLMWWNFVARTPEEIAAARADWAERRRFGEVTGYAGPRLEAPELTARFVRANPVS